MTFFTVSSIIGRQFLIQTTMSCVGSLGNLLTRAFIYLSFSSGSSGNGELLHIHFLCRYCYRNHSRSIYVVNEQCAWVLCKCLKQCNVQCAFQKCIENLYTCIHPPPNITKSIMYAPLEEVISSLIWTGACAFNLLSKRMGIIFTFIIIDSKIVCKTKLAFLYLPL